MCSVQELAPFDLVPLLRFLYPFMQKYVGHLILRFFAMVARMGDNTVCFSFLLCRSRKPLGW